MIIFCTEVIGIGLHLSNLMKKSSLIFIFYIVISFSSCFFISFTHITEFIELI